MIFKNGLNASKDDYGSGYKFINVLDIINNDFIKHDCIIGSVNVKEADFQKNIVEYGDILFQRSSETREEVGQANVYLDEDTPSTFGGFVIRGKKKADYNPIFLNYLLKTASARKEITSKSGGSTRYNVGQETLSSVKITIPIIEEQNKIASLLSKIEARISTQSKIIEDYKLLKKGLMQKIFKQKLCFKDENGNAFPEWEDKKMSEIATFFSGGTPKSTNSNYYSGNIPFIGSGDISKEKVDSYITYEAFDSSSAKMVEVGDILYALYGATSGEVSLSKMEGAINQAVLCIKTMQNKYFIAELLKFNKENIVGKYLQGGQGNLSAKIVKDLKFLIPSIPEQQKIASTLTALDNKIELEIKHSNELKAQKQYLLQNLFV